jgi:hypothetical protein
LQAVTPGAQLTVAALVCGYAALLRCCVQAEVTVGELVRVVSKAMLLHLPVLVAQPGFASLWVAVLSALAAAAATGNETLSDAAAAALQNLLIMLAEMVSDAWEHLGRGPHERFRSLDPTGVQWLAMCVASRH